MDYDAIVIGAGQAGPPDRLEDPGLFVVAAGRRGGVADDRDVEFDFVLEHAEGLDRVGQAFLAAERGRKQHAERLAAPPATGAELD